MYVLKFDENHNIPMKQLFYVSGNNENCVGLTAKIN